MPSLSLPHPNVKNANQQISKKLEIAAIILAAGQSRRMGVKNKLLMPIKGVTMIVQSIKAIQKSNISSLIIVTGHQHKFIEAELKELEASFIYNPLYKEGISSSLKAGIVNLPKNCDGALICLGDMPLVTQFDIQQLIDAFDPMKNHTICLPTHKGKWGNPVLIGRQFFSEIQLLSGDIGARHLIRKYHDYVCEVKMQNDGVLRDFDNLESFKKFN